MTSRERVMNAISRRKVDRIPIDLGGMKASGIAVGAYDRVKKLIGLKTPTRVWDARFMLALVENEFRERFAIDTVPLDWSSVFDQIRPDEEWVPRQTFDGVNALFPPGTRIREEPDGSWVLLRPDGTPTSYRMPKGGYYFDDISFNRGEPIDPKRFRPVDDVPDEQLDIFASYARELFEATEYAILGWGFGLCFLGLSLITDRRSNVTMGMPDDWMTMLMTEKETCHEMMNRAVEASIKCMRLVSQAVGRYCFAWGIAADDAGTQRSEFISPDLWAEMIKPHYKRYCDWIHRNTTMKTFLHCCGSIYHLIPHFIEAGVDILNPVQTSAANMEPERLKKEFGSKIVFWGGGMDTQHVLARATPEEIRAHVRERISIFGRGGGYVFNQVHNIQANVPPENIVAMLDAAREYGAIEQWCS
ncbi:MAG: hypothetical protein N2255_07915 [Kiritimatiellae bacterium]|nr:hypothetical protein [Kiritimatiellia bacterium]